MTLVLSLTLLLIIFSSFPLRGLMGNGVTILIKNNGFHEKQRRLYSGAPKIRQMLDVSYSCKVAMFLGLLIIFDIMTVIL